MTIRNARGGDAAAIAALWNAAIRGSLATFTTVEKPETDIARMIEGAPEAWLVAEDAGGFAGFASYGPFRPGPGYRHSSELNIYLSGDAQGRGLGRALMEALTDRARAHGIHVMVAGISSANPGAIAFHERMGFGLDGRIPEAGRKWDQWLDLILMSKRIEGT